MRLVRARPRPPAANVRRPRARWIIHDRLPSLRGRLEAGRESDMPHAGDTAVAYPRVASVTSPSQEGTPLEAKSLLHLGVGLATTAPGTRDQRSRPTFHRTVTREGRLIRWVPARHEPQIRSPRRLARARFLAVRAFSLATKAFI